MEVTGGPRCPDADKFVRKFSEDVTAEAEAEIGRCSFEETSSAPESERLGRAACR